LRCRPYEAPLDDAYHERDAGGHDGDDRPQSAEEEFLGRMRGHLTRVEEAAFE
jgi:hypothetical protein